MKSAAASLLLLACAVVPSRAATRDEVYRALQRCNVVNDNRVWLDCLYGAVQPMRAELGLPSAPEGQVRLVPQGGPTPSLAMAHPSLPAGRPAAVTHPEPRHQGFLSYVLGGRRQVEGVPLRDYRFDGTRHFTVTLANGQVWRQADDDIRLASWTAAPTHYIATIKTGSLGSSILQVQGDASAFVVRPVR